MQRGVTARAFDQGAFPAKDAWVFGFGERYRRDVEETPGGSGVAG